MLDCYAMAVQKDYRVRELARLWHLPEWEVRGLFQDEPGVTKTQKLRGLMPRAKARIVELAIPAAVAETVYTRLGGAPGMIEERHYRVNELAKRWAISRVTVTRWFKNRLGVVNIRRARSRQGPRERVILLIPAHVVGSVKKRLC